MNLCPARHAGLYAVTVDVFRDHVFEFIDIVCPLRARADKAHFTPEHVDKLGKLVQARQPEKPPDRCLSGIAGNPQAGMPIEFLGPFAHRAKLQHCELTPVQPNALLPEQHRPLRGQLDEYAQHGQEWKRDCH